MLERPIRASALSCFLCLHTDMSETQLQAATRIHAKQGRMMDRGSQQGPNSDISSINSEKVCPLREFLPNTEAKTLRKSLSIYP